MDRCKGLISYDTLGSLIFGLGVLLFWALVHPEALNFQESHQLFLFSWDYLAERLSQCGGLADYVAEFIIQFYCLPWLGAALTAVVFVAIQRAFKAMLNSDSSIAVSLSFIPSLMLLCAMGDENVQLGYAIALSAALLICFWDLHRENPATSFGVWGFPLSYWFIGPLAALPFCAGIIRICAGQKPLKRKILISGAALFWAAGTLAAIRFSLLTQFQFKEVLLGVNYHRIPLGHNLLQCLIAPIALLIALPSLIGKHPGSGLKPKFAAITASVIGVLAFGCTAAALPYCYPKAKYELMTQDLLIRQGRWEEIVSRARRYQVKTEYSSVSVNLALAKTDRLEEDMDKFHQCGMQGLLMPVVRDFFSNSSTAEAFWQLGMVNSALRYNFDMQEAAMNDRKSGRLTTRITECQIINGRYDVARKYIARLKKSLFYRRAALEMEPYLDHPELVAQHPVWGLKLKQHFEKDFLYYYPNMPAMLLGLWQSCPDNKLAEAYFKASLKLNNINIPAQQESSLH
ncbi:MAG: hypothetical protein HUJ89_02315 [Bacteroidales bacterium]|nr:hypothetical protein [Bacteroidales bacterium]